MALMNSFKKLKAGDQAPFFILLGIDDREHSLKGYLGKPTLIVFMCNHCPYVRAKLTSIIKLKEKFKNKINVVGINSNDPKYPEEGADNMKKFAMAAGINFDYLIDDSQKVARAYGAVCTPDPFLFDSSGNLAYHGKLDSQNSMETATTADIMESNINKLLSNEKISDDFVPSQGCSIKWKQL